MAICWHSLGFVIGFNLVIYFLGLNEDLIHLHPLVEEFYDLVLDYICMCNNFLLWPMEAYLSDHYHNLGYNDMFGRTNEVIERRVNRPQSLGTRFIVFRNQHDLCPTLA